MSLRTQMLIGLWQKHNKEKSMKQQTKEWHDLRRTKIGGSDAPVIAGVSPWRTPYQLWQEKLGLVAGQSSNSHMERGLKLEDQVRLLFVAETGISIQPMVMLSKEHDWMMASLDGVSSDKKHAVEIKCPGQQDHETAIQGNVPAKYIPQLQHQMKVLELDKMYYASYLPNHDSDFVLFHVKRDEKYIENLVEIEKEFWDCVRKEKPPQMVNKDFVERSDEIWLEQAYHWKILNKTLKDLEKKEKEARESLINMAIEKNTQGGGVKLTKLVRKGTVDYTAIPELNQIDLEQYRKSSQEYWKITDVA